MTMTFGEQLMTLRKNAGESFQDVADAVGASKAELPRVYRRVEHSKDEPYDEETLHPRLSG